MSELKPHCSKGNKQFALWKILSLWHNGNNAMQTLLDKTKAQPKPKVHHVGMVTRG